DSHRAGQPIDVHAYAAPVVAEHDVAAAGTAVGEITDARDAGPVRLFRRRGHAHVRVRGKRAWITPRRGPCVFAEIDGEPLRSAARDGTDAGVAQTRRHPLRGRFQ